MRCGERAPDNFNNHLDMELPREKKTGQRPRKRRLPRRDGDIGCCGYIMMALSAHSRIFFPFPCVAQIKGYFFCCRSLMRSERGILDSDVVMSRNKRSVLVVTVSPVTCVGEIVWICAWVLGFSTKDSVTVSAMLSSTSEFLMPQCNHKTGRMLTGQRRKLVVLAAPRPSVPSGHEEHERVFSPSERKISEGMQVKLDNAINGHYYVGGAIRIWVTRRNANVGFSKDLGSESRASRDVVTSYHVTINRGIWSSLWAPVSRADRRPRKRITAPVKEAAEVHCESPAAIQLRYLQTLNSIAA
ncbi:hypothetical protein ScPMuIL_010597 [Solemya velum]